jgi:hypothetical protein
MFDLTGGALVPVPSTPIATAQPMTPAAPLTALVSTMREAFRSMSPDQLLDLAIQRLRAALPAEAQPVPSEPVHPLQFYLVPLPPSGGRR